MTPRIAIIGLGSIAQKAYLPILTAWEGIELLFCSRSQTVVERLQAQHRVAKGTTQMETLLDWQPSAAFVLAATPAHAPIAAQLLTAGVDIYLEKPPTTDSEATHQLAELAEAHRRILMVGFNRRYAPLHRLAREQWGERHISLASFEKHRSSGFHPDLPTHYTEEMVHIIDMLRFFCGEGQAVETCYQQAEKLTWAASRVALHGGGYASLSASMQAGHWREHYALHGEGASLYVEAFSRVELVSGSERRIWEETYPSAWKTTLEGRGFYGEIAHFLECVQTRSQPQTSILDALKTQQLTDRLIELATESTST
jgi:virulence factor